MFALGNRGIVHRNGLMFDPLKKVKGDSLVCVSHAHSDHARSHDAQMLMTPPTADLAGLDAHTTEYGKQFKLNGHELTMHNAGHMLGSAQFRFDSDGEVNVYTGDLKLENSILFSGAEILECDNLVIESTFGTPKFDFPSRDIIYNDMKKWILNNYEAGRTIFLGGYAMGKAQELTKIVTKLCDIPVIAHDKVYSNNITYNEHGVDLGEFFSTSSTEGKELMKDNFVCIVPMHLLNHKFLDAMKSQSSNKIVSAVATGWASTYSLQRSKGVDRAFMLSDHADYTQLLHYVEQSGAKRVFTIHGYADEFARNLRKKGLKAEALRKNDGQKKLTEMV